MITKIAKEYKWEMSHRLPFHQGPCKNLHGHSYKLFVMLEGEQDKNSMVIDYYDIDSFINPILNKLDHSFICDENDSLMIDFLKNNGFKYHVIPYYTTSENLVTYLLESAVPHFSSFENITQLSIRVYETVDAYAERTVVFNKK
jgi:6-pyruvoyltetrahydropterin/6-carboxytetrahydropterin synthase